MDCPRGSICTESTHEVKTIDKAREWLDSAKDEHLPLTINQWKGEGGRIRVKIYDRDKNILETRG